MSQKKTLEKSNGAADTNIEAQPTRARASLDHVTHCNPKNSRRHGSKQIAKLSSSIRNFGFNGAIVIDENNVILAGHARHEASLRLGLEQVPCLRLRHLSPDQKKAFAIADNKMSDLSSFDDDVLRSLMKELALVEFDMELTGFDTAEIDLLVDGLAAKTSADPADSFGLPDPDQRSVSRIRRFLDPR